MNSSTTLHTKKCKISLMQKDDSAWLHSLIKDEDILKKLPGLLLFSASRETTLKFINSMQSAYDTGRGFLWKIEHDNTQVGFICIFDFDESPTCSYAIKKEKRRQGIMSECLEAVLSYLYSIHKNKKTFHFDIEKRNTASLSVCQKLSNKYPICINITETL